AYTSDPRAESPGAEEEYGGGPAPEKISGFDQRSRIPFTITSTCLVVSIPPALSAKAGIDVPGIPPAVARCRIASSATARYTGFASAIAAPPFPSEPWQPEQFCAYKAPKSELSRGTIGIFPGPGPGRPGALVHPHKPSEVMQTTRRMSKRNLIVVRFGLVVRHSIPVLQSRHAPGKARTGARANAPAA